MKKSIQIALTSIALILTSILGLTIMLHGMYSKINVKGAAESRASNNMANISPNDNGYRTLISTSWLAGGRVNHSQITIHELGGGDGIVDSTELDNIVKKTSGTLVNGQNHFWFSIRWNVQANFPNNYLLPINTVVHILLNGYSISGNLNISTTPNSALKLYDYVDGNINNNDATKYFGRQDPRTDARPVRFYRYNSNKNAYSTFIDTTHRIGETTTHLPANTSTDVTSNPTFTNNNNYIKVDGSVIGPGFIKDKYYYDQNAAQYEAKTQLEGNIELYGVNIVGNNSPDSPTSTDMTGGILSTSTSTNTIRLYNCTIIGNNVNNNKTTVLDLGAGGNVNLKWCNIYKNYAENNIYGTISDTSLKTSDIYAPSNVIMQSVDLQNNVLGNVATNNQAKGNVFLRETNLNSLHVASSNVRASLVDTIGNNRITGTLWLINGGNFTVNVECPSLTVKVQYSYNRLTLNSNGKISSVIENNSSSATNTYIINGGHIGNNDTLATKGGTVEINNGTITLQQTPASVYGNGTAILDGVSTTVPSGKTLNRLKHKNNSTVNVNGTVAYIQPEGGNGTGNTTINNGGIVQNISISSTVTVNSGGTAENVSGGTTVNMNGGIATIGSGNSKLYGNSGQVTIAKESYTTAVAVVENVSGKNRLGATVTIQSTGTLYINSGATVTGQITNNGTLNVAGIANNIQFGTGNTGTVDMNGGTATIISGSGKLYGTGGQVTINNSATATVENTKTLGSTVTIQSAGTLNVAGTANNIKFGTGNTGTVNMNGNNARATITSGSGKLYGTGGQVTINSNAEAIVENTKTLGATVTIQSSGTLTINSGATVTGQITNNGILNVAGTANNIQFGTGNTGTVHMNGNNARAIITSGSGKLYGTGGQVTISNNATATVENTAGKNTLGANVTINGTTGTLNINSGATATGQITNNGVLNVVGTANNIQFGTGNTGTVNMNGNSARATITSGSGKLYGTGGQVTINSNAEAIVENTKTLGATVTIQSSGTLTINSGATVTGQITNNGILNVAGTANNIQFGTGNTGTVHMNGNNARAIITSGSGKLYGTGGQVTISNNATATVENTAGKNTLGANVTINGTTGTLNINSGATATGQITNNGVLNVAGTASGATITNNKTLNLKQGGSIPGNFTNNANGTLVVESGVTYTITANSLGGTIKNQGILTIQNNLAANITNQGTLTIQNGLNGTITNQGTLTIQNGTVQTLDNQSGKEVIIDSGANSNNSVTIDNLTNNGTFTVRSGTYIIPNNKTLSGTVVNETNGIIELQGDLRATSFTNNGSLRIPRNKTFEIDANGSINGLSGKILNSGILNVNGALNSNATLTNEEYGTVNLGSNGTLPNNFTNNGTLVITAGTTKTISNLRGSGIIKNQGNLTISGNATVVNNKATTNSNVTLNITSGTVYTSGTATTITTGGCLYVKPNESLTADIITSTSRIEIHGTVTATTITSQNQFHLKPNGKIYGTVNISNNAVQPIIEGIIGDASHSNSVLNISSGQTVEARNGANIWNVTGNGQLELRQANTVVHVRGEFNGIIQNYNGIVNLYENARVGTLRNSASANDKGIYIKGDSITITTLSSTGRFTIEQNGIYILKNNQILNGTVINNGTLTLIAGCTLTDAFTNNGTFNIGQNVLYRIVNTELGRTINNRGTLYVGESNGSGIARNAHVTNSGTIYVKSNFSNFTNQDLTQQGDGKLMLQSSNSIIIERTATWTGGTIENSGSFKMYGTLINCTVKNTAGEFFSRGSMTGNIEQTGGEIFVDENLTGNITTTGGYLYIGSSQLRGNVSIGKNARAKICGTLGADCTVTNNSNQLEIGKDVLDNNTTKIGNVYNLKGTGNFTVKDGATVAIRDTNTLTGRNESGNLHLYTSMKSLTNSSTVSIKGGNVTVADTLSNTGTFQIENTGSFTIKDSQTLGGITRIDNGGNLVVNGVVDDVSGNGTLTINTNGEKKGQATVKATKSLDGTITNTGILNIQGTLTATTTFTNNGELNLAENVSYTVLNSMNLSGIINNRGILTIAGSAKVVNNYNNLTVDGTIDVVTNNNITKNTNAQVTVNGTVKDLSGNSTVSISSNANVTVVEGKEVTGIVTNNNGTLTVNGRADDVSGNGILTINTNGDKIGEVTVKAGKTLSGNVTNNGILNMNGTLDIPNFTNDGTFNLNQGADILNPFTNNGTFQIGQDVTYQVREQDNLTNGTVVNNGVLTVGVGTIKNLVSTGTTDIQANANVTTLVVSEGYTTLYADSIVGTAELKANGTLEIFNKADLTNLTDNEGGRLIDHRIGPQAIMGTRGFPWLWILIIISGTLLLILLILILLLIKRKREKVYADEIYDRIEDISLYSSNENN